MFAAVFGAAGIYPYRELESQPTTGDCRITGATAFFCISLPLTK